MQTTNAINGPPSDEPRFARARFPARRDLQYSYAGGSWNAFDPLTRQSVRIGPLEKAILGSFDGNTLLAKIAVKLVNDGVSPSTHSVFDAAERLVASGLVRIDNSRSAESTGQAATRTRTPLRALRSAQQMLSRFIVWQVRGFNPERFLRWLAPRSDFFFSRRAVIVWCLLMCATAGALCFDFQRFWVAVADMGGTLLAASPLTGSSSSVAGGCILIAVFLATRAIHELAHAVVCQRHGVRCPDIGVLLILFAPCVYCDVTESWRLTRRSERAAVAAAGMYAELIVATVAAVVWLSTVPSILNTIALQTMLICSVSTILINANPLMRFDGYYILADWLNEVSLRAQADRQLSDATTKLVLGLPSTDASESRGQGNSARRNNYARCLIAFSLAGWAYRCMLSFVISAAVVLLFRNWELVWLGRMMGALILFSWWGIPMLSFASKLLASARLAGRTPRLVLFTTGLLLLILTLPIPTRRFGAGWVHPESSQKVFATADAQLLECYAEDGQAVEAGQALFRLASPDTAAEVVHHVASHSSSQIQLDQALIQRNRYAQDVDIESYETRLTATQQQKLASIQRLKRLNIAAHQSGLLVAAVCPPAPDLSQWNSDVDHQHVPGDEEVWTQSRQLGRRVSRGELLATICSQEKIAVIPLSDEQLADVAGGTRCKIHSPDDPSVVSEAQVARVVELNTENARTGVTGAPLPENFGGSNSQSRYAAIVKLPAVADRWPIESPVQVVFHTQSASLFDLARNFLRRHLRFLAS